MESLTDLSAVRPRGPKIFAAIVAVAVVAAALWFVLRPPGPRGASEDPGKVLVVADTEGLADELIALGFAAEQVTLSEAEARATETVDADVRAALTGPAAILVLADELGFGYVAFEDPSVLDFGNLLVSPESADVTAEHRFATFSIGELASPHHVAVDDQVALYAVPSFVPLLRALFGQDKLAAALLPDRQRSIEAGPLAERLEAAIDLLGAYNTLDVAAKSTARAQTEALVQSEEAEPVPEILAGPLDRSAALPAGDGGVLLLLESPTLSAARSDDVELDYPGGFGVAYVAAGDVFGDRQPCDGFDERYFRTPDFVASIGAQAIAFFDGGSLEVWRWSGAPGRCAYARAGVVPTPEYNPGALFEDGRVVRRPTDGGGGVLEVWTPGSERPEIVSAPGCTHLGAPVWLDAESIAVMCTHDPAAELLARPLELPAEPLPENLDRQADAEPAPPQHWLFVVRRSDGATGAASTATWGDGDQAYDLLVVPSPAGGFALVATERTGADRRLVRATRAPAALVTPPEGLTPARPDFVAPTDPVIVVPADAFTVTVLELGMSATGLVASPDGRRLAFEVDAGRVAVLSRNLAVMSLDARPDAPGGDVRRVTDNPQAGHHAAFFSADSASLLFRSAYASGETIVAGRRLRLASSPPRPPRTVPAR